MYQHKTGKLPPWVWPNPDHQKVRNFYLKRELVKTRLSQLASDGLGLLMDISSCSNI